MCKSRIEGLWDCSSCGTYNSSANDKCKQCDGPRADSKGNYSTFNKLTGMLFNREKGNVSLWQSI